MEDVRPPDLPATPRSSPPGPNRRGGWRSVQIVEGFQARFILTNLSYLTASLLGVAFVLFSKPTWVLLTRPPGQDTAATASTFLLLHALVWPTLVAIVLISAVHLTVTTHKVAGPLVRFRRVFQQMADGNFRGPVVLRDGDYLKTEATLLSSALATLERRDAACRAALEQAEKSRAREAALVLELEQLRRTAAADQKNLLAKG